MFHLCFICDQKIVVEHKEHKEPQSAQSSEPDVFNVVAFVKKSFVAFVT